MGSDVKEGGKTGENQDRARKIMKLGRHSNNLEQKKKKFDRVNQSLGLHVDQTFGL